jgi:succinyl-CoA synthetase beta subunit
MIMKLFEHEAKEIISKYGIPIPRGGLANSPNKAQEIAKSLRTPFVVKAQILVAGRGKAGGILFADSAYEVGNIANKLLGAQIKESTVHSVRIEEKLSVKQELYFGVTVDRSNRRYSAVASSMGGVEIEEVATSEPEKISKLLIDPLQGFRPYHARQIAKELSYSGKDMLKLAKLFQKLYQVAMDYDAQLIEMNPLVETTDKEFVAVDARLIIDDNAVYRHPEFNYRLVQEEKTELPVVEMKARKEGLTYVKLTGNVGVIGNGAGLVMATLDMIHLYGGNPANFLDVGGGASAERVAVALDILLSDPSVKVVFINILGGITRCNEVAEGILAAKERMGFVRPIVIRLVGTNEDEGKRILRKAGFSVMNSMEEAAKKVVELASNGG